MFKELKSLGVVVKELSNELRQLVSNPATVQLSSINHEEIWSVSNLVDLCAGKGRSKSFFKSEPLKAFQNLSEPFKKKSFSVIHN